MSGPSIVQFIHRGDEHTVGTKAPDQGIYPWNLGQHKRKFLQASGTWLDTSGTEHRGPIRFWGEWEPPSTYRRLPAEAGDDRGPTVVHEPLPVAWPLHPVQNTDPLVFGDRLTYSNCLQRFVVSGQSRTSALWDLSPGSLILFGTGVGSRGQKQFILDTVLVTSTRTVIDPTVAGERHADLFATVVCGPLAISGVQHQIARYEGCRWDDTPSRPFSFSPCVPADQAQPWFSRPVISPLGALEGRVTPGKTQWFKRTAASPTEVLASWGEVVRQVRAQGAYLGVNMTSVPLDRDS